MRPERRHEAGGGHHRRGLALGRRRLSQGRGVIADPLQFERPRYKVAQRGITARIVADQREEGLPDTSVGPHCPILTHHGQRLRL
jgi:hypothetical protein